MWQRYSALEDRHSTSAGKKTRASTTRPTHRMIQFEAGVHGFLPWFCWSRSYPPDYYHRPGTVGWWCYSVACPSSICSIGKGTKGNKQSSLFIANAWVVADLPTYSNLRELHDPRKSGCHLGKKMPSHRNLVRPFSYWCSTDREWGNDPYRSYSWSSQSPSNPSIPCVKRTSKFWWLHIGWSCCKCLLHPTRIDPTFGSGLGNWNKNKPVLIGATNINE